MAMSFQQTVTQEFRKKSYEKEVYASIPCTDTSDREIYLNNPSVREALHVPNFVPAWEACRYFISTSEYQNFVSLLSGHSTFTNFFYSK